MIDTFLYYWFIKPKIRKSNRPKFIPNFFHNVGINDFLRLFLNLITYCFIPMHFRTVIYSILGIGFYDLTS